VSRKQVRIKRERRSEKGLEGTQDPVKTNRLPLLRLGGLQQTQKEISFKQMMREEVHRANLSILLSLYPKNSAIASGATPIGSAVVHPIEISRQKKNSKELWLDRQQNIDYSHREVFTKSQKG
jgi:hypothetical protein